MKDLTLTQVNFRLETIAKILTYLNKVDPESESRFYKKHDKEIGELVARKAELMAQA